MKPLVIVTSPKAMRVREAYTPGEFGIITVFISDAVTVGGDGALQFNIDGPITIELDKDGVLSLYSYIYDYELWLSGRLYATVNGVKVRRGRLIIVGRLIVDALPEQGFYSVRILKPEDAKWIEEIVIAASKIAVPI
jgi:hypothetical protein